VDFEDPSQLPQGTAGRQEFSPALIFSLISLGALQVLKAAILIPLQIQLQKQKKTKN